jgi:hypothetical protein
LAEPNHELFLKPRKVFRDPFRGGDHILVLCDTFYACQVRLFFLRRRGRLLMQGLAVHECQQVC